MYSNIYREGERETSTGSDIKSGKKMTKGDVEGIMKYTETKREEDRTWENTKRYEQK